MLLSSACGRPESDFTEHSTYNSPDEDYSIIVDSAHSKLAFGPETLRFYMVKKESKERKHIVTTKIANDGGLITDENLRAEWIQNYVIQFCLSGAEQNNHILRINLRTLTYTEKNIECS